MDLFIQQKDGKKIVDPEKQSALCSRLKVEMLHPLRVIIANRGPDTELLVANPVELCGKGRPRVFYDVTRALKALGICIFSVRVLVLDPIVCCYQQIGQIYASIFLNHSLIVDCQNCFLTQFCFCCKAEIGRHSTSDREWEVYRFLLDENCRYQLSDNIARHQIADRVRRSLMGL